MEDSDGVQDVFQGSKKITPKDSFSLFTNGWFATMAVKTRVQFEGWCWWEPEIKVQLRTDEAEGAQGPHVLTRIQSNKVVGAACLKSKLVC